MVATNAPGPQVMQERILFGGLTALFSTLGVLFPAFLYIAPIPLGVLTYRQGMRIGAIAAVVAAIMTGIFIHAVGFTFVVLLLALGLALGGGLREGLKPGPLLVVGTVVTIIVFTTLFLTVRLIVGVSVVDELFAQWEAAFGPELSDLLAQVRTLLPAMVITSSVGLTFFNMFGIQRVLAGRGEETPWFPPFRTWRPPLYLGIAFLLVQGLKLLALPAEVMGVLANVEFVLYYVFVIAGIAVVAFFTHQRGMGPVVPVITALFAVFVPFGQTVMVLLGLVDSAVDIRRRMVRE